MEAAPSGQSRPEAVLAVELSAAQVFGRNLLSRGSFDLSTPRQRGCHTGAGWRPGREAVTHQRRSSQEDGSLLAHDDAFVGHGGYVRSSGRARAHHNSNLAAAEPEGV